MDFKNKKADPKNKRTKNQMNQKRNKRIKKEQKNRKKCDKHVCRDVRLCVEGLFASRLIFGTAYTSGDGPKGLLSTHLINIRVPLFDAEDLITFLRRLVNHRGPEGQARASFMRSHKIKFCSTTDSEHVFHGLRNKETDDVELENS